jgi:hypothetical protein
VVSSRLADPPNLALKYRRGIGSKKLKVMNKIAPIKKIDLSEAAVGKQYEIHADRLASFKSTVCGYNNRKKVKLRFNYATAVNNYITATCTTIR